MVLLHQEWKSMPELVDTRDDGYKVAKYEKIVPLLINNKRIEKRNKWTKI